MTKKHTIIQICTFRPEKCGIASWTEDLINYSHKLDSNHIHRVFAVNGHRKLEEYTDFVEFAFNKDNFDEYVVAANKINEDESILAASIQHEFGIFGGHMGDYVIDFLKLIKKPKMMTFHTVPRKEDDDPRTQSRKKVLEEILPLIDDGIVISNTAKEILVNQYGANPNKLHVILHGTHTFDETTEDAKKIIGHENQFIISTVGLVRPKRGLEYVLKSLPAVFEKHPEVKYILAGETHPREIVNGVDVYRNQLMNEIRTSGIEDNVHFVNNFLPLNNLLRYIQASDICVTPYTFPGQISSGVLSYCVGLGKPVVSTPFLYAKELLSENRGVLLPDFNNPDSMSDAICSLIENEKKRKEIQENLKDFKDTLHWSNVAKKYLDVEKKYL